MTAFWYANAVFNIASDLVIIVLPVPVILGLQLPRRTRGGLCAIFAVGVLYFSLSFSLFIIYIYIPYMGCNYGLCVYVC